MQLDSRKTLPDLLLEPEARRFVPVAEKDRFGIYAGDKVHQVIAIGVGCQVKVFNLATAGELPAALTEEEGLAQFGSL